MRRRRVFRGWAILWAVLQFALPAAASFADAHVDSGNVIAPVSHVEATSGAGCRPAHPTECAICQLLSHSGTPAQETTCALVVAASSSRPVGASEVVVASDALARLPLPRAPPAA
jgi:hypothetical protein